VDLSNGVKINGSTVVTADIEATNGVIHVIDTVLVPSDFTLNTATSTPIPQTGDNSMVPYALLFVLSGAAILVVNRKRLFEK
jgi:LPXTG-motif cell wall-anchored protein